MFPHSKDFYKTLYAKLREVLNRHDPIGLAALGAPADEYEPEVGTIIPRLQTAHGPEDVTRIVYEEFARWFGDAGSESAYSPIGEEVWRLLTDMSSDTCR